MTTDQLIETLKKVSGFESQQDLDTFLQTVVELANRPNAEIQKYLPDLLLLLNDESGYPELDHPVKVIISGFGPGIYLPLIGNLIPTLQKRSVSSITALISGSFVDKEWDYLEWVGILKALPETNRTLIRDILHLLSTQLGNFDANKRSYGHGIDVNTARVASERRKFKIDHILQLTS